MSEYNAMNHLAKSAPEAKRDSLHAKNRAYIERQLEYKKTKQAAFWGRVRKVLTLIALAIIAYTLFDFT